MSNIIKLTESDLHNIIKESVNQIIRENNDEFKLTGDYTDEEKAKQEKAKKSSERAKKSAATRAKNKSKKDKEAEDRFMKQQRERGYKGLFEGSYDNNGDFDETSHNDELQEKFINKIESLSKMINDNIRDFDYIAQVTTDDEINRRARVIVSALLSAGRDMRKVMQLTSSDRWDVSE